MRLGDLTTSNRAACAGSWPRRQARAHNSPRAQPSYEHFVEQLDHVAPGRDSLHLLSYDQMQPPALHASRSYREPNGESAARGSRQIR